MPKSLERRQTQCLENISQAAYQLRRDGIVIQPKDGNHQLKCLERQAALLGISDEMVLYQIHKGLFGELIASLKHCPKQKK
jgi:hypothetical protein